MVLNFINTDIYEIIVHVDLRYHTKIYILCEYIMFIIYLLCIECITYLHIT